MFIALGPPDETIETTPGTAGRVIRWTYLSHRLALFFQDETGFGRLRLTPGSRAEFERVAESGEETELASATFTSRSPLPLTFIFHACPRTTPRRSSSSSMATR